MPPILLSTAVIRLSSLSTLSFSSAIHPWSPCRAFDFFRQLFKRVTSQRPATVSATPAPAAAAAGAGPPAAAAVGNQTAITSPMVGTFYRAPAPDADPYVEVGDTVTVGQTVCIVEAMKLMNEIESEVKGRVVKILVENAQPVEYGQKLFLVET